MALNAPL